jgi:hypothetical protein
VTEDAIWPWFGLEPAREPDSFWDGLLANPDSGTLASPRRPCPQTPRAPQLTPGPKLNANIARGKKKMNGQTGDAG